MSGNTSHQHRLYVVVGLLGYYKAALKLGSGWHFTDYVNFDPAISAGDGWRKSLRPHLNLDFRPDNIIWIVRYRAGRSSYEQYPGCGSLITSSYNFIPCL